MNEDRANYGIGAKADEDLVILSCYFLHVVEPGWLAIVCPHCKEQTIWRAPSALPRRCSQCGRLMTIRLAIKTEEEACQPTSSSASSAALLEKSKEVSTHGKKTQGSAPDADQESTKSGRPSSASSSRGAAGQRKEGHDE